MTENHPKGLLVDDDVRALAVAKLLNSGDAFGANKVDFLPRGFGLRGTGMSLRSRDINLPLPFNSPLAIPIVPFTFAVWTGVKTHTFVIDSAQHALAAGAVHRWTLGLSSTRFILHGQRESSLAGRNGCQDDVLLMALSGNDRAEAYQLFYLQAPVAGRYQHPEAVVGRLAF